jgi:putative transposase
LEVMIKKVQTWKPRSAETRQAKKYLVQQLLARGYKRTEVAARLGVSRKTVYNILHS